MDESARLRSGQKSFPEKAFWPDRSRADSDYSSVEFASDDFTDSL
jgi:hypothetical protein